MSQDLDISWQVLRRIVRDWAGDAAELAEVKPLDGGCINTTVALTTEAGDRAVLKISSHRVNRSYENEAYQLERMRQRGLPVPRVYAWKTGSLDDPHSFVLLEFMDGVDLAEARRRATPEQFEKLQCELAQLLLRLHSATGEHYGRVIAGDSPTFASWSEFYRSIFEPIQAEVEKSGRLPPKTRKTISRATQKLNELLQHDDVPRLVHWDVWATNILAKPTPGGDWAIAAMLDPNCKFAHVEAELAYLELFKTAGPAFMKTYQLERRLGEDYHRVRKPVYQMYSLMNHLELFGGDYLKLLIDAVEKVATLV
jgi:fructosamine-3-kinase